MPLFTEVLGEFFGVQREQMEAAVKVGISGILFIYDIFGYLRIYE